jgi:hypothetical protein
LFAPLLLRSCSFSALQANYGHWEIVHVDVKVYRGTTRCCSKKASTTAIWVGVRVGRVFARVVVSEGDTPRPPCLCLHVSARSRGFLRHPAQVILTPPLSLSVYIHCIRLVLFLSLVDSYLKGVVSLGGCWTIPRGFAAMLRWISHTRAGLVV